MLLYSLPTYQKRTIETEKKINLKQGRWDSEHENVKKKKLKVINPVNRLGEENVCCWWLGTSQVPDKERVVAFQGG